MIRPAQTKPDPTILAMEQQDYVRKLTTITWNNEDSRGKTIHQGRKTRISESHKAMRKCENCPEIRNTPSSSNLRCRICSFQKTYPDKSKKIRPAKFICIKSFAKTRTTYGITGSQDKYLDNSEARGTLKQLTSHIYERFKLLGGRTNNKSQIIHILKDSTRCCADEIQWPTVTTA